MCSYEGFHVDHGGDSSPPQRREKERRYRAGECFYWGNPDYNVVPNIRPVKKDQLASRHRGTDEPGFL